jgi:hypothetical protein
MTGHAELIAFYELTQAKAKYCQHSTPRTGTH